MKYFHFLFLAILFVFSNSSFAKDVELPEYSSRIVDMTGKLKQEELQDIENRLAILDANGTVHIAVLLLSSTKPLDISEYSIKLARKWKVGEKEKNNGLILILAMDDKKARLEVARGLEGDIPDITAKKILSGMSSDIKKNGLKSGILKSIELVEDELNIKSDPEKLKKKSENKYSKELTIIAVSAIVGGIICAINFFSGLIVTIVISLILIFIFLLSFSYIVLGISIILAFIVGTFVRIGGTDIIPFINSSSFSSGASDFSGVGEALFDGAGAVLDGFTD